MLDSLSTFSFVVLALCPSALGAAIDKRIPVPAGYVAHPYYPAPHGGWAPDWAESYRKASLIVSNLTLAEKTNITAGTGIFMGRCVGNTGSALRAGIPQLCVLYVWRRARDLTSFQMSAGWPTGPAQF